MVVMAETIVGCFAINDSALDMETVQDNQQPFVETSTRQLKKLHPRFFKKHKSKKRND
jgi:hypothetical protein